MIQVAVILVNWNGKKDTLACLASLKRVPMGQRVNVSVIVVDNGSTDDSVAAIKKNFSDVEVLETGRNLGFAGGNNVGVRRAIEDGADFVWLLNNDTTAGKNALTALIDVFADRRVGIAGSKIYFAPGNEFHKERYQKQEQGKVLWYTGGLIDWQNMYASHRGVDEVDKGQYDEVVETSFVTGCSMMVRKEVLEKIGLLDEKFFAYLEDLDFCLRAKRMGYRLLYVPQSVIWHKNAGSSGVGSDTHQYYMTRNRLIVGMRYASVRTKFALVREAMRSLVIGKPVVKRAVRDWFLGKYENCFTRHARAS